MRLSASIGVSEPEVLRLVAELREIMWHDPEEMKRRIHLVAQRYSRDDEDAMEVAEISAEQQR